MITTWHPINPHWIFAYYHSRILALLEQGSLFYSQLRAPWGPGTQYLLMKHWLSGYQRQWFGNTQSETVVCCIYPSRASPCWALVVGWGTHGQEHRGGALGPLKSRSSRGDEREWKQPWISTEVKHFIKIFNYFWPYHMAWGIFVPQPGIKPVPPAVETRVPTTGLPGNSWGVKLLNVLESPQVLRGNEF